jgi:hypothetical protein
LHPRTARHKLADARTRAMRPVDAVENRRASIEAHATPRLGTVSLSARAGRLLFGAQGDCLPFGAQGDCRPFGGDALLEAEP